MVTALLLFAGCKATPDPGTGEGSADAAEGITAKSCERSAAGQSACLIEAFSLTECSEIEPLGSAFRDNEKDGTYQHRTAFSAPAQCIAELRKAADRRGFSAGDERRWVDPYRPDYSELLLITVTSPAEYGSIEWERTKA